MTQPPTIGRIVHYHFLAAEITHKVQETGFAARKAIHHEVVAPAIVLREPYTAETEPELGWVVDLQVFTATHGSFVAREVPERVPGAPLAPSKPVWSWPPRV